MASVFIDRIRSAIGRGSRSVEGARSDLGRIRKAVDRGRRAIKGAYVEPLRCRYADGGALLALKIQSALAGRGGVIRIDHLGDVSVNGKAIGKSYGTQHLGSLMMEEGAQEREIVIVVDPQIGGQEIERFIVGMNTGDLEAIDALRGCALVFIKDYNLLGLLHSSNLPTIKVSPRLSFSDEDYLKMNLFFKKNSALLADFRWFNHIQRTVLLRLLSRNLLNGLFNDWNVLSPEDKTNLLKDLTAIDVEKVYGNIENHRGFIDSKGKDRASNVAQIKGRIGLPNMEEITDLRTLPESELVKLAEHGRKYKETGRFGVVILAAGAATRFGRGPKALVKVDGERTFIQIAVQDVYQATERYKWPIPLFNMVSEANGEAIIRYLNDNGYFGLKPEQAVHFYQDKVMPRIYSDGNLALTIPDKKRIDFAPTGHGFVVSGIKYQILTICQKLNIKTLFIRNIDNLGATISDFSSDVVLGAHLLSGRKCTIELVEPKIEIDKITGRKKLLDSGGGALSLDGRNALVEAFAVPKELESLVVEKPFNTLSLTLELDALEEIEPDELPWYITSKESTVLSKRWRRYQFEQLLGDVTHQIAVGMGGNNFVVVDREGPRGRFLPVKRPADLDLVREVFREMEKLKKSDPAERRTGKGNEPQC